MLLTVSAIGIVSSVGWDAHTTCASIRAGLSRPQPLSGTLVMDPSEGKSEPAVGHPILELTDGFSASARWLCMGAEALGDLQRRAAADAGLDAWDEAALVVVTPDLEGERFMFDEHCHPEWVQRTLPRGLLERVHPAAGDVPAALIPAGRAAPFVLLEQAEALMRQTGARRLVFLVVDSWLDGHSFTWLREQGRLQSPEQSNGFAPGEAAVALLLEPADAVRRRGTRPMATVVGYGVGEEPSEAAPEDLDEESEAEVVFNMLATGTALTNAMWSSLEAAEGAGALKRGPSSGLALYADLNGEAWRARDLGIALHRVASRWRLEDNAHLPAASVGDVGAAAGALGLALAARALQQSHHGGASALVVCRDEAGASGACVLSSS